jgi:hypothetical protein
LRKFEEIYQVKNLKRNFRLKLQVTIHKIEWLIAMNKLSCWCRLYKRMLCNIVLASLLVNSVTNN